MTRIILPALWALAACCLCGLTAAASSPAIKRPMHIHQVRAIGLEVWTEASPEWDIRIDHRNGQATFVAETPALTVPPAGMSWTSRSDIRFGAAELLEGARGAIQQIAKNYGVSTGPSLEVRAATYGNLTGYEADFSANSHGTPVDVRVFCGHQPGKPAVVMHAFTLQGRLSHIREHMRRSWTHVNYLH